MPASCRSPNAHQPERDIDREAHTIGPEVPEVKLKELKDQGERATFEVTPGAISKNARSKP